MPGDSSHLIGLLGDNYLYTYGAAQSQSGSLITGLHYGCRDQLV
jgi:hypothetical protein